MGDFQVKKQPKNMMRLLWVQVQVVVWQHIFWPMQV